MKTVKIVRLPFLIPFSADAQVIFPEVIFLRRGVPLHPILIAHELAHVQQIARLGVLMYWIRYVLLFVKFRSHQNHPMEQEADRLSTDPFYLRWAEEVINADQSTE